MADELKITEFETAKLIPDPENARRHPLPNKEAIRRSIKQFGIRRPIVASEDTNIVYAGNGVLEAAIELGIERIPVAWIPSGTPVEICKAYAIADNRSAELAEWDPEKLEKLVASMPTMELADMGFDEKSLREIISQKPIDNREEAFDVAAAMEAEAEPITKTGDVWICGKHRIMCGDSTKEEDVGRLFASGHDEKTGLKASLIWTDPPYGVRYGYKLKASNPMGYKVRSIEGDDKPPVELEALIRSAYLLAAKHSVSGASLYATCPAGTLLLTAITAFLGSGFDFHWQLVWVKDLFVLSRADYHFRHENVLYGWKPDGTHFFTNDRTQDSIFEIMRPKKSEEHPTMKPVALVEVMIENSSRKNDVVYDPFLGSGTTIIACEKKKRRGVGMEINPHYVDICCRRYYNFTGNVPINEVTQEPFLIKQEA